MTAATAPKRIALPLAAALLLAGCATGPRYPLYTALEVGQSFGYSAEQTSADSYRVTYKAPIETTYGTSRATRQREADRLLTVAYDLALRRAAELALANGYPAFRVARRDNEARVNVENNYYDYPFFGSPFGFYPPYSRRYGYPFYPYYRGYSRPSTQIAAEVTLEVAFQRTAGSESFDAKETLARLQAQYGG